ncbi:MAG TPA: UvrD-helicase domain-containing protein [Clostridiales bacterium]|jgi:DNA helicase-2/ATP-dependent DNA helicase PcrA|nr:UvrD-helicase domain-containing protein [Clostridiales bacterium]
MNKTEIAKEYCLMRDSILEKLYRHLNQMQRQAVLTTQGPLLVLAGAGSGKTTVLTNRVAHIVRFGDVYKSKYVPRDLRLEDLTALKVYEEKLELGYKEMSEEIEDLLCIREVYPSRVLAITFTNKAAREMKERIFSLLGEEASDIWVSTFHSACVRILRREIDKIGYAKNFVIYDDTDQLTVIKECLKDLNINEKYFPVKEVRAAIGKLKDDLKSPQDYAKEVQGQYRNEQLARLYSLYESKLKKNNALDFDDLLNKTLELFYLQPDVLDYYRNRFHYILVDEYQDTNFAQYMLVKLLSDTHRNICVVGDDDQSIYRWRGADIRNILEFEKDFPNAKVIKLEENYRSHQTILDAANQVIRHNIHRKEKKLWTRQEKGEAIRVCRLEKEQQEADFVCNEILNHIRSGGQEGDIAILYRMNAQSRTVEEALMKYAIPYNIYGGLRFYDRKEIKDIIAYLRILDNPLDDVSLQRIINVPKRGIGSVTLAALQNAAASVGKSILEVILDLDNNQVLTDRIAGKVRTFARLILNLRKERETRSLTDFINTLLQETEYQTALMEEDSNQAENRLENIAEFVSAAREFENNNPEAGLTEFLENIALVTDLDRMDGDREEGRSSVSLMTLHSAKGLEFPVVFLIGLEEGLFPHSRSMESEEEMEEERRLCYVGITRAKKRLYLTYTSQRTLFGIPTYNSPSRFLHEIPEDLINDVSTFFGYGVIGGYGDYRKHMHFSKTSTVENSAHDNPSRQTVFNTKAGKVSIKNRIGLDGKQLQQPSAQSSTTKVERFQLGEKVYHSKFGNGTVVTMEGEGSNRTVRVAFEQGGIRSFIAELAPLKKV